MSKSVINKIKQEIKRINKHNSAYYIATWILWIIFIFIFLTTILQTNWVGIQNLQMPILVWIISLPYVGVFFLPFIILTTYISWFICAIGKPVDIRKVQSDICVLFEDQQLTKDEYDQLYKILSDAHKRNQFSYEQKLKELQIEKQSNHEQSKPPLEGTK